MIRLILLPFKKLYDHALAHPTKNCMTYSEHALFSLSLSQLFFKASLEAAVHAFCPFWFERSSTNAMIEAHTKIKSAGCQTHDEHPRR